MFEILKRLEYLKQVKYEIFLNDIHKRYREKVVPTKVLGTMGKRVVCGDRSMEQR